MSGKKVWGDQDKHLEIIQRSMGVKPTDVTASDYYPDDTVTMYRSKFYDFSFMDFGDEMPAASGEWRKCGNQGLAVKLRKVLWVKFRKQ